jgi:glycosyltransferase involved in cell wall biosynthesis
MPAPKIAIVADWLTAFGGAERVVLAMQEAFPNADIYTSVYEPEPALAEALKGVAIHTTFIQKFPKKLRRLHKWFPVIRTWGFRRLDLSAYDIILTSSSAESKQVRKTRPGQVHICYCHTPIRYYWSHYDEYLAQPGFGKLNWLVRLMIPLFLPGQRRADFKAAQAVDVFIANSTAVQARIKQYYKKPATVIHPPVDVKRFAPARERDDYFVAIGRQMPYKRIDLAVAAATRLGVPLKVFGNGSQHQRLIEMAGPKVSFYTDRFGDASDAAVAEALNHAKGLIFPSTDEDFGITMVEGLAAGAPVIAYGKGGALDIVDDGISGILYKDQTVNAVSAAIQKVQAGTFLPGTLQRKAKRFETSLFITKIRKVVGDQVTKSV